MTATPKDLAARRPPSERLIELGLSAAAVVGIATTIGIVVVLVYQTLIFFNQVDIVEFLTGTVWSASIKPYAWGILPLLAGTLLIAFIAILVGAPLGLLSAVFLAEYASDRVRNTIKPILEAIAGIPTIVLGFFAINWLTPVVLKPLIPGIGGFSALAAGIVVGILITPLITSLSDDAIRAVPRSLREGAYAMGATKWEVIRSVVFRAGISGIAASLILAVSRAAGETMAVYLAAGTNPQLTLDPRESVETMTVFIAAVSLGDTPATSIQYQSLFAVGAMLF
ncbi:MAG TPA: phosphate ABC transporter permease subunit PstC, partial [Candidatus Limnocylindrales bacterium]